MYFDPLKELQITEGNLESTDYPKGTWFHCAEFNCIPRGWKYHAEDRVAQWLPTRLLALDIDEVLTNQATASRLDSTPTICPAKVSMLVELCIRFNLKVIGKKAGKITISVDPQNELGVEEVTIKMPDGLKAKVNDKVAITIDGDKQTFEVTSKEAVGKTSRSSTPRHSMDSNAGLQYSSVLCLRAGDVLFFFLIRTRHDNYFRR